MSPPAHTSKQWNVSFGHHWPHSLSRIHGLRQTVVNVGDFSPVRYSNCSQFDVFVQLQRH